MELNLSLTSVAYDNAFKTKSNGKILYDATFYRKIIGNLLYFTVTCPNISFVVHKLSQCMQSPK